VEEVSETWVRHCFHREKRRWRRWEEELARTLNKQETKELVSQFSSTWDTEEK
jgi:hypothetical protein